MLWMPVMLLRGGAFPATTTAPLRHMVAALSSKAGRAAGGGKKGTVSSSSAAEEVSNNSAKNGQGGDSRTYRKLGKTNTMFGLSGRYASSLFAIAAEEKCVETVEKELGAIASMAKQSAGFASFLEDPTIPRPKKKDSIGAITQGMTSVTQNFFALLAENGRLNQTSKIAEAYSSIVSTQRREVKAYVTSAKPLSPDVLARLKKAVRNLIKPGHSLELVPQVDPRILGGLSVKFGGRYIDLSILGRVNNLKRVVDASV